MSRPLPPGDPSHLGPFRLSARLSESPAGIVYQGVDPHGRQVSVAVLNRGAASDAAARDRFRAAINGEMDAVVGAQLQGPAPWVATLRETGRPGAERFLDAVLFEGRFHGRWGRRGPQFQPYWLGSSEPALAVPEPVGVPGGRPSGQVGRGLAGTVLFLAGLLVLLTLLLALLFACRPSTPFPKPPPPSDPPSPSSAPASPRAPAPSPTPSTGSPNPPPPSPNPGDTGGSGGGGPL